MKTKTITVTHIRRNVTPKAPRLTVATTDGLEFGFGGDAAIELEALDAANRKIPFAVRPALRVEIPEAWMGERIAPLDY